MVAVITTGKSFSGLLYYNEHKVEGGQATCIDAVGFGRTADELSVKEKLHRFQKQARYHPGIKTNVVHVALSFDRSETDTLNDERLRAIAASYMDKLGFGDQPYLLYRHKDAANPHIHIMTTNVQSSGDAIPLHNIGKGPGMAAREAVEEEFRLVKARGRQNTYQQGIPAAKVTPIHYGTQQNKSAISYVVRAVISKYHFTSLEEFNAILRPLNVVADPGSEGSLLQQRGGLLYSVIDGNGEKVGSQIKASSIYLNTPDGWPDRPTLAMLNKKFAAAANKRKSLRERLVRIVDGALHRGLTLSELRALLHVEDVEMVMRYNRQGNPSGVTFIDHGTGAVFKGSDLHRSLGAAGISARTLPEGVKARRVHRALVRKVLRTTPYQDGFTAVVQHWNSQGMAVQIRRVNGTDTYLFVGAASEPPDSFIPASPQLNRYILANLSAGPPPTGQQKGMLRHIPARHRQGTNYNFFTQELPGGSLFSMRDFWDELTRAEPTNSYVPAELLKEARKKKRKKRKH